MNNRLDADLIARAVSTARAAALILPPRGVTGVPAARAQDHKLAAGSSRRGMLKLGLAAGLGGLAAAGAARPVAAGIDYNWRYCGKCGGLFFAGNGRGACPKGGKHNVGRADYELEFHHAQNLPQDEIEQNGWRYCNKCAGLFYSNNGRGVCPRGRQHDGDGSGDYSVDYNA